MQYISRINRGMKEAFSSSTDSEQQAPQPNTADGSDSTAAAAENSGAEGSTSGEMEVDVPEWRRHLREYTDFTRNETQHEGNVKALVELIRKRELQLLDLVREFRIECCALHGKTLNSIDFTNIAIESSTLAIYGAVKGMDHELTTTDTTVRARATLLLSAVRYRTSADATLAKKPLHHGVPPFSPG
eukprot:214606-Pyramimonas_sp.AAC.1